MDRRLRLLVACALSAAACTGLTARAAFAYVTTDLTWSLDETTKTYGGGTQFHISQDGDGTAAYRWLDADMTKTTVISANGCSDLSLLGKSTYAGGDTDYHTLFFGPAGYCFVVRGRTTGGSTISHNGRLRR